MPHSKKRSIEKICYRCGSAGHVQADCDRELHPYSADEESIWKASSKPCNADEHDLVKKLRDILSGGSSLEQEILQGNLAQKLLEAMPEAVSRYRIGAKSKWISNLLQRIPEASSRLSNGAGSDRLWRWLPAPVESDCKVVCCLWLRGKCWHGEKCRWLHSDRPDIPCSYGLKCDMKKHRDRAAKALQAEKSVIKTELGSKFSSEWKAVPRPGPGTRGDDEDTQADPLKDAQGDEDDILEKLRDMVSSSGSAVSSSELERKLLEAIPQQVKRYVSKGGMGTEWVKELMKKLPEATCIPSGEATTWRWSTPTPICCNWLSKRYCAYFDKCRFAHFDQPGISCQHGVKCKKAEHRTRAVKGSEVTPVVEGVRDESSSSKDAPVKRLEADTEHRVTMPVPTQTRPNVKAWEGQDRSAPPDPWESGNDPWNNAQSAAKPIQLIQKTCVRCNTAKATGAFDPVDREWYCMDCGFKRLDEHEDRELAAHVRFLRQYAVVDPDAHLTHSSLMGFSDPTCFIGKFDFPYDKEDVIRRYCSAVAYFYDHQYPLLHMECIGRDCRIFCVDIDILYPKGKPTIAHALSGEFLSFQMCLIADIYPSVNPVRLHVYKSSGISRKYGHWKESIHCVLPDIKVDELRAATLRQHTIEVLNGLSGLEDGKSEVTMNFACYEDNFGDTIRDISQEFLEQHEDNTWVKVFDSSVVVGGNGLRVPLCDKRDRPKSGQTSLRKDRRPKEPIGTWEFDRDTLRATCNVMRHSLAGGDAEWVRLGLCRCAPSAQLTEWVEPVLLKPLETGRERRRQQGSCGDYAAGIGRRSVSQLHDTSNLPRCPAVKAWEDPGPQDPCNSSEIIALWHDGSRGEHGISGSATLSLLLPSQQPSRILFSGYLYISGSFTAACAEYLGFFLGLRQLVQHRRALEGRELWIAGDSRTISRHMSGQPPADDSDYLIPMMEACRKILDEFESSGCRTHLRVVERHMLTTEDKMAKAALREMRSSLEDADIVTLFRDVESIWRAKSDRTISLDAFVQTITRSSEKAAMRAPSVPPDRAEPPAESSSGSGAKQAPDLRSSARTNAISKQPARVECTTSAHDKSNLLFFELKAETDSGQLKSLGPVGVPIGFTAEDVVKEYGKRGQQLFVCDTKGFIAAVGQDILLSTSVSVVDAISQIRSPDALPQLSLHSCRGHARPPVLEASSTALPQLFAKAD